jgi:hypothetical protein
MSDLGRNGLMVEIASIWTWIADQVESEQMRREDAVAFAEERMFDLFRVHKRESEPLHHGN